MKMELIQPFINSADAVLAENCGVLRAVAAQTGWCQAARDLANAE